MEKIYINMIKDILNLIDTKSININHLSAEIGITKKILLEYLTLEKKDFSMYLLILDKIRRNNYESNSN